MFIKCMKFFQFCIATFCVVFCSFSFASTCEEFLLPENTPDVDERAVIAQVAQELNLEDQLQATTKPAAFSMQPLEVPNLSWFAEENLLSSTQVSLDSSYPKNYVRVLAEQAFRLTSDSFKQYKLVLNTQMIQPQGRPRIRVGFIANVEPEEQEGATLAVFAVASADQMVVEKNSLDLLRINLVFYKHLRDLLNSPQTHE